MDSDRTVRLRKRPVGERLRCILAVCHRHPIALVLVAFAALGATYLYNTPPFESPDEYGHYAYVRYIVEQRGLPPLLVSDHEWAQGQMHQPPLYYALGALLVGNLDTPEWQAAYPRNQLARLGHPETLVHRNAVVHPGIPAPAASRTAAALRWLRTFSLACSLLTVWLAYRLALLIAPQDRWLATGTAAALAFTPQFVFVSASANNDVLVTALSAAALYLSAQVARAGGRPWRTPILIGLLVGLAGLAKLTGLAALMLPVAAYLLYGLKSGWRRPWRTLARPLLLCGSVAALVAGPWLLRNTFLYSDPLGMRSVAQVFSSYDQPLLLRPALQVLWQVLPSYWGVFGWLNVLAPPWFYRGVHLLSLAAGLGLLAGAPRLWPRRATLDSASVRAALVAALWALLVLGLMLRWTQTIIGAQGRHAFPAAGVVSLALVAGLTGLAPRRWRSGVIGLLGATLFVVAALMPWRVIAPAYQLEVRMPRARLPEGLNAVNVRYGQALTLIAAEVLTQEAVLNDYVWVRMYWATDRPLEQNYTVAVQLVGADGGRLGGLDTQHAMGRYPSNLWQPGDVTIDNAIVPVERAHAGPVAAAIRVAVYASTPDEPLPAFDGAGVHLGTTAEIGRIRMVPDGPSLPVPQYALDADFGGLTLYGYDLDLAAETAEGVTAALRLYWLCAAPVSDSYTVFVHLVDLAGELVDQADSPPMQGAFGTDYWREGDRIRDPHVIWIPAEHLGEPLSLRVGLYLPSSNERRPLSGVPTQEVVELQPPQLSPRP